MPWGVKRYFKLENEEKYSSNAQGLMTGQCNNGAIKKFYFLLDFVKGLVQLQLDLSKHNQLNCSVLTRFNLWAPNIIISLAGSSRFLLFQKIRFSEDRGEWSTNKNYVTFPVKRRWLQEKIMKHLFSCYTMSKTFDKIYLSHFSLRVKNLT